MMEKTDILAAYKRVNEVALGLDKSWEMADVEEPKPLSYKEFEILLDELCEGEYRRGMETGTEYGYWQGYDHASPDPFSD
jgi:hypothetical protein